MIPFVFRMPDRGLELQVALDDATFRPLVGQIRVIRPDLADAVERSAIDEKLIVELDDADVDALALAARVLRESQLVNDPELEKLAEL